MKLSEKRILFSKLISQLVLWASENGYDLAFDQVKRTQAEASANAAKGAALVTAYILWASLQILISILKGFIRRLRKRIRQ